MSSWLGTAVGAALAAVPLCWTLLVLHRHRAAWLPLDVLLAALAWQGLVQQAAALLYSMLAMSLLGPLQWCSAATWLLASAQTLQAGTLVTLAVTRLLRLRRVTAVTRTHLIYHLISLTLLSACVGITAVLAREEDVAADVTCAFLPHELDPRYAVLSLALHSAFMLAAVLVAGACCCLRAPRADKHRAFVDDTPTSTVARRMCLQGLPLPGRHRRRQHKNQALFTSSSDLSSALSDFSSVSASAMGTLGNGPQGSKTFWNYAVPSRSNPSTLGKDDPPSITFLNGLPPGYPTDTLEKALGPLANLNGGGPYSAESTLGRPGPLGSGLGSPLSALRALDNSMEHRYRELCGGEYSDSTLNRDFGLRANNWTSDNSYMSTTTSPTSTNSRAPCLSRQPMRPLGPPLQLPCVVPEEADEQDEDLRLPTALAVLALCYLTNHIPILGASCALLIRPGSVPASWPLHGLALWGGELQACLLPLVLAIFDSRFGPWVARLYARQGAARDARGSRPNHRRQRALPHAGKFRPYDLEGVTQALRQQQQFQQQQQQQQQQQLQPASSHHHLPAPKLPPASPQQLYQSQSQVQLMGLAVQEQLQQQQADNLLQPSPQQQQQQQQAELQSQNGHHPKFPITNGSLFTSLDGHIPIVHNYRRRRDMQMGTTYVPVHSNQPVIVHNGGFFRAQGAGSAGGPQASPDEGTLHSPPLPHQHYPAVAAAAAPPADEKAKQALPLGPLGPLGVPAGQSASCEQLARDPRDPRDARDVRDGKDGLLRRRFGSDDLAHLRRNLDEADAEATEPSMDETGDDEDDDDDDEDDEEPIYATLSSGCSVTTAANDDFEFYQHAVQAAPAAPAAQGYHKLSKKPRGPDLSTAPPPPPPLPAAQLAALEAVSRGCFRAPPPPPPPPPPPAYKKRQGFHEVDLRDHLTTADLLELYSSAPTRTPLEDAEAEPKAKQQLSKAAASARAADSDDDGRGIYSYHDVIRGCQLDDLDAARHAPPAAPPGRRQAHPHHHHGNHGGHRHHGHRSLSHPHQPPVPQHGPRRPRHPSGHMNGHPSGHPSGHPPSHLQGRPHPAQLHPPSHPPGHSPGHPPGHGPGLAPGHPMGHPQAHPPGPHRSTPALHHQQQHQQHQQHQHLERGWTDSAAARDAYLHRRAASSSSGLDDDADDDVQPGGRRHYAVGPARPPPHSVSLSSMSSVPSASGSRDPLIGHDHHRQHQQQQQHRHHGYQRHAAPRTAAHGTPPSRRRVTHAQRKAAVTRVLSLDSLHLALQDAAVSYLDTGDVCSHHLSQPDLHRVFVSDFI